MSVEDLEEGAARELRFMAESAAGWSLRTKLEAAAALVLVLAAALVWALWPPAPVPEVVTRAPQVRQDDGSVIAERAPPVAKPAPPRHRLPRGAVEERREQVIVAPAPAASSVEVDLSLIRQGNERRVVASSPDGEVLRAIDIPLDPAPLPPPARPWAAGLSYGTDRAVGVWIERDIGKLRAGLEVERGPAGHAEARVRVGVTW